MILAATLPKTSLAGGDRSAFKKAILEMLGQKRLILQVPDRLSLRGSERPRCSIRAFQPREIERSVGRGEGNQESRLDRVYRIPELLGSDRLREIPIHSSRDAFVAIFTHGAGG